jgi:hydrogenase 3 maturation protease
MPDLDQTCRRDVALASRPAVVRAVPDRTSKSVVDRFAGVDAPATAKLEASATRATRDLHAQLESCFAGQVCLMGIGNVDYGDDGFGVRLAEELLAKGMPGVVVADTSPERYLGQVSDREFDHLLFLDAVEFGGPPGSVVFMDAEQLIPRFPQISTHKISLGVLAKWAEANGKTKAWLLGVEPESTKPAQQLTPAIQTTLEALAELLCNLRPERRPRQSWPIQPVREVEV